MAINASAAHPNSATQPQDKDDGGALLWMLVAAEIGIVAFGTMAAYALV